MMYAAVLLAFVVVVTADVPKEDIAKMDDLDVLLNRLTARAQNLKDKIDGKLNNIAEADRKSKNMILRMDRMNVNDGSFKCPRGENGKQTMFKCGTGQQCIGNILVCDNVADCLDGSDEDPDYCKLAFENGTSYQGFNIFYTCSATDSANVKVRFIFTDIDYNTVLHQPNVASNLFWNFGDNEIRSYPAKGKYNYATRSIEIPSVPYGGKLVIPTFWFEEDMLYYIARFAHSGEICGLTAAEREKTAHLEKSIKEAKI